MKRALLVLLCVLICSAKPTVFRDCEVTTELMTGRGYRIGGGYVLTVNHILCEGQTCVLTAKVNGRPASVVRTGSGGGDNSPDDDGCDWALLYAPAYKRDEPCVLRLPVEGEQLRYRGKRITVRAVADATGFDGQAPIPGESGSGVIDADGALCGVLTTRMKHPGDGNPVGYFCAIHPEIIAAVEAAREAK